MTSKGSRTRAGRSSPSTSSSSSSSSAVGRCGFLPALLTHPVVVFLLTVFVRLAVLVWMPQLEAMAGTDTWLAHPTSPALSTHGVGVNASVGAAVAAAGPLDWLRRATPHGVFYTYESGEEAVPSFLLRFSSIIPPMEAAVWRDAVFLTKELRVAAAVVDGANGGADSGPGSGGLPDYIAALAPWYAKHLPAAAARQPLASVLLALCDGATAAVFAGCFPSTSAALLYLLFVLNPFTVAGCVYASLQPLEMLLLTLIVQLCRRSRGSATAAAGGAAALRHAVLLSAAVAASLVLGSAFLATSVALLFPTGHTSRRLTHLAAIALAVSVSGYALGCVFFDTHERTSRDGAGDSPASAFAAEVLGMRGYTRRAELSTLYAPIDNGVLWYVRQVVLPAFEETLSVLLLQLPAMAMIPLCVVLPDMRQFVDAHPQSSNASSDAAAAKRRGERPQPLFTDTKVFTVVFSVLVSFLFRPYFNLPYLFFGQLLIYSNVNRHAGSPVQTPGDAQLQLQQQKGAAVVEEEGAGRTAYSRARIIVPLYILIVFATAQLGLYVSFCLYEVGNANWLFFTGVAVTLADAFLLAAWLDAVAGDIVAIERLAGGW